MALSEKKIETKSYQWQQTTQLTKTLPLNKMVDSGRPSAMFLTASHDDSVQCSGATLYHIYMSASSGADDSCFCES